MFDQGRSVISMLNVPIVAESVCKTRMPAAMRYVLAGVAVVLDMATHK